MWSWELIFNESMFFASIRMFLSLVHYLKCAYQNYAWGKKGTDSEVAQLLHNSNNLLIKDDEFYAELWMGTHSKGPSEILLNNSHDLSKFNYLSEYIETNPENILGSTIIKRFGPFTNDGNRALPFLFKVLSINLALSIQAHPNKKLAEILHKRDPSNYPDDNHKPEIAIAINQMQALCGFRPPGEITKNLKDYPELETLIGESLCDKFYEAARESDKIENVKANLKMCFTAFMESDADKIEKCLNSILARIRQKYGEVFMESSSIIIKTSDESSLIPKLIIKLNDQFPGDIGCLSVLFLNFINLQPGKGVFLGQDEPHAYLSGDCVECMACSDNVVRAGLTPKFKDIRVLCDMLTYNTGPAVEKVIEAQPLDLNPLQQSHDGRYQKRRHSKLMHDKDLTSYVESFVTVYRPPVLEFAVQKIEITHRDMGILRLDYGVKEEGIIHLSIPALESASIMIVIRGLAHYNMPIKDSNFSNETISSANEKDYGSANVKELKRGSIIFVDAEEPLNLDIALNFDFCEPSSTENKESYFLAFRAYTPT